MNKTASEPSLISTVHYLRFAIWPPNYYACPLQTSGCNGDYKDTRC